MGEVMFGGHCGGPSACHANSSEGNVAVRSESDFAHALEILKDRPLYAEKWANFRKVTFSNRARMRSISYG